MVTYKGIGIEDLPQELGSRLKASLEGAEPSLEILLERQGDGKWKFGGYSEVYAFDFGVLREVYFNVNGNIYRLGIRGIVYEIRRFSEAFGLKIERVSSKPEGFGNTRISIGEEELEIMPKFGHTASTIREDRVGYHETFTGPYVGKKKQKYLYSILVKLLPWLKKKKLLA